MDQKKLYGRWNFWEEFVGYPMMIFYWIKGEKISKMLSKRIEKLEGRSRMAPWSTYLKELKQEASKILQFWN